MCNKVSSRVWCTLSHASILYKWLCFCVLYCIVLVQSVVVQYLYFKLRISPVQVLSHSQLFAIPWTAACQASLSITNSWSLVKLMSIESVMPSNLSASVVPFSSCLYIFPSIRVSSNESVLHIRWQKY